MHTIAAALLLLLGMAHSILGERLIFGRLDQWHRTGLPVRRVWILRATWHFVTVCGWGFAAILLELVPVDNAIALSSFGGSMLVLILTRGRHPGWVVLLVVALLIWLG